MAMMISYLLSTISPMPLLDNDGPVCEGQSVQLSASGGLDYAWTGPNGFTSSAQNPVIDPANPEDAGTYTVVVTDANACTSEAITSLVIHALPTVSVSNNGPLCEGADAQFSASGGSSYTWSGPNGFAADLPNPVINAVQMVHAGVYTVTITDDNACSNNATTELMINSNPQPQIQGITSLCFGATSVLSLNQNYASYTWSNGASTDTIVVSEPGNYSVTVSDANACIGMASVEVIIADSLSPMITGDTILCEGDSTMLEAGPGYATYLWSTGSTNASIVVSEPGNYAVSVSSDDGCSGSGSISISAGTVVFSTQITDESCLGNCDGSISITDPQAGYEYHWSTGDEGTSIDSLCPGSYALIVSDENGCMADSILSVGNGSFFTLDLTSDDSTLTANPSGGTLPYTYLWSTGDSTMTISPEGGGTFSVTVTDSSGCTATEQIDITDLLVIEWSGHLTLFPNPARDIIYIEMDGISGYACAHFDP